MDYDFVGYSPEYKTQLAKLRGRVWGGSHAFNCAYLEWKYEHNPYLQEPHLYLAFCDKQLVGMYGTYGTQWTVGRGMDPLTIPAVAEFVVDTEHRGRGLGSRLMALARQNLLAEGFEYTCCVSANMASRILQLRAGWKRAVPYQYYRRGDFSQFDVQVGGKRSLSSRILSRARARISRVLRGARTIVPFQRFDEWAARADWPYVASSSPCYSQLGELAAQYNSDHSRIQHVRDERFYEWRLRDMRNQYRSLIYEQNSRVEGFLILQQPASGGVVTIVDWATSTVDVWTKLLEAVVSSGIERLQIGSTSFSEAQVKSLRQSQFELFAEPDTIAHPSAGIFLDALSDPETETWLLGGERLLDPDRWDMRMIYSDFY